MRKLPLNLFFTSALFVYPAAANECCRKMKSLRFNICTIILTVFVFVGVACFPIMAFGQCPERNYYWVAGSGNWSTPGNWQHEEWNPQLEECIWVPGVPSSDDWVWVANGGTANVTGTANVLSAYVDSSGVNVPSGSLTVGDILELNYGGFCQLSGSGHLTTRYTAVTRGAGTASFIHTGGVHTVTEGIWIGEDPDAVGTYELSGQGQLTAVYEDWPYSGTGVFRQFGGTNTVGNTMVIAHEPNSNGTYELSANAELYAPVEVVGQFGNGTLIQTGGTNAIGSDLVVGNLVGSEGTYELSGDAELYASVEVVGQFGNGTLIQTGGTNAIGSDLVVGNSVGSDGTYELSGDAVLSTQRHEVVGVYGTGHFRQTGGTNIGEELALGELAGGTGTYELSADANLSVQWQVIGRFGNGTFIQSGGTSNITNDLFLGLFSGSDGQYQLLGGNLNVGGNVEVGMEGTGSFVMSGGTINGTTGDAELICSSTGTLTGPGTFNIEVTYESDEIYGTNNEEGVNVDFGRNCLTEGGSYNVTQITPSDFADGNVPNLLESSVFSVSFDGSFAGDLQIAIPYNEAEVAALGISETSLRILRETGLQAYEVLANGFVDKHDDIVCARTTTFGKYAVGIPSDFRVVEVRGQYCGPGRHTYYLAGISLQETFTVKIDWEDYTPGKVKWITPSGTYEDECPGTTVSRSFDMGSDFGVDGRLRVVAVADGGSPASEEYVVNFNVIQSPPGIPPSELSPITSGNYLTYEARWAFNFINTGVGEGIIDDEIPGFGGRAFKFLINTSLTAKVSGDGSAVATLTPGFDLPKMDIAKVKIKPSVSVSLNWQYASEQKQWLPGGSLQINVSGKYITPPSYTVFFVGPVPVPVYWRTALEAALGVQLALIGWEGDSDPTLDGSLPFHIGAEIMLGVGVADVLAAEGYLGGGANMLLEFPNEEPLQQLSIELNGGIRLVVFIFRYENNLLHYEWYLVGGESAMMIPMALSPPDIGEFEIMQRDYLGPDYAIWAPGLSRKEMEGLMMLETDTMGGVDPNEEQLLQYNVFSQSQPTIAADGNDLLLAWVYDDPNRDPCDPNSVNRTEIVFSKCGNYIWTEPVAIDDDGTADFSPQIVTLPDGNALCIWEDANQALPNDVNLADMAAVMEIAVGFYDSNSGLWTVEAITDNNHLDRSPRIASADDNTAIAVWIYNEQDDILGADSNALNEVRYATWDGANWGEPNTVASDIGLIIKTALAYDGNEAVYVYTVDPTYSWETATDRELYAVTYDGTNWSAPNRLTDDALLDANPQIVYDENDTFLVWYRDANLVSCYNFDMNNIQEILLTSGSSGSMDFRLANNPAGQISLTWTEISSQGIDIFTATYDSHLSTWSKVYQLTSDPNMEHSITVTYAGFDELALAYNKVKIIDNNGIPEPNRVDLYILKHQIEGDLVITAGDISLSVANPLPGSTVDVNAVIHNMGDVAEVNVTVAFYNGDPDVNGALIDDVQIIAGPVPAGDTPTATASWFVPAVNEAQQIYVVVDPNFEIEDANRNNNIASIAAMAPDFTVAQITSEKIGSKMRGITARIRNLGGLPVENIDVEIHRDSATGPQLADFSISHLDPNSFYDVWHMWDIAAQDFNNVEIPLYVIADSNDTIGEFDEDNNIAFGMVQVGKIEDITDNAIIDFEDFAKLANSWFEVCSGPDWCEGSDFDKSGMADLLDLAWLCEDWLWQAAWYSE